MIQSYSSSELESLLTSRSSISQVLWPWKNKNFLLFMIKLFAKTFFSQPNTAIALHRFGGRISSLESKCLPNFTQILSAVRFWLINPFLQTLIFITCLRPGLACVSECFQAKSLYPTPSPDFKIIFLLQISPRPHRPLHDFKY